MVIFHSYVNLLKGTQSKKHMRKKNRWTSHPSSMSHSEAMINLGYNDKPRIISCILTPPENPMDEVRWSRCWWILIWTRRPTSMRRWTWRTTTTGGRRRPRFWYETPGKTMGFSCFFFNGFMMRIGIYKMIKDETWENYSMGYSWNIMEYHGISCNITVMDIPSQGRQTCLVGTSLRPRGGQSGEAWWLCCNIIKRKVVYNGTKYMGSAKNIIVFPRPYSEIAISASLFQPYPLQSLLDVFGYAGQTAHPQKRWGVKPVWKKDGRCQLCLTGIRVLCSDLRLCEWSQFQGAAAQSSPHRQLSSPSCS